MRKPRDPRPRGLDCDACEPLFESGLDGELAAAERALLDVHLASCARCAEELELARRVREELRALPEVACPPAVTRAALDQAAAHPSLRDRLRRVWGRRRIWQPAVAFLLVTALGVTYYRVAEPPPPAPAYSSAEIERARAEVELAFAYLGEIGDRARDTLGAEVEQRVVRPMTRSVAGALLPRAEAAEAATEGGDDRDDP